MRISLYYIITFGVILASLAFYFQKSSSILASIFALTAAFLFIKGANAIRQQKRNLKLQQKNNKNKRGKK